MAVIGFKQQRQFLTRALERGLLAHAYLLSGPAMLGKRLVALELAAAAVGSGRTADDDPDIRIVSLGDDVANIPIEDIRDVRAFLALTPLAGQRRVVVVDDAHRMTQEAANAFLKVLEEPPVHGLILLISSEPGRLPRTIVSRCQEVRFPPHDRTTIAAFLAPRKLADDDVELLVALAGGRIGWLVRLLDGDGLAQLKRDVTAFKAVVRKGIAERLQFAQVVAERGDRAELAELWLRWVRAYGTNPDKYGPILTNLLELRTILAEPQFNARLAIERFLLSF